MPDRAPQPNVFVVDDDRGLLRLIEKALQREGFATATAASGKDAIEWLTQNRPDLMLLDLKLQDIEGKELINHIEAIGRSVPFIIITGQGDERVAVEMMKRGALDYLVKDVRFVEFVPTVIRKGLAHLKDQERLATAERQARRLEREILEVSDREQRRIGQDLHDNLGQQLTALELFTQAMIADLRKQAPKLLASAGEISRQLQRVIRDVRTMAHVLSPVSLETYGLQDALRELARGTSALTGVRCNFDCDSETQVNDLTVGMHLYRIAQEAVNNAVKHARARQIHLRLREEGQWLTLTIEDDGRGFSQSQKDKEGMGLGVMQHRAGLIGASLHIDSVPGTGTKIICRVLKKL
jgi:signal transduction histidine kinase